MSEDDVRHFEALFREGYPDVTRYVVRRVDPDEVQEIVSEVFLTAWRRFDSVPTNPLPWLLVIARNLVGNEYRRRARVDRLVNKLAVSSRAPEHDPMDDLVDRVGIRAALASLRPLDQEVLRLAEWDDLSPADAATVLGCSVPTYRVRLHRARRRLEAALVAVDRAPATNLRLLEGKEAR